MAPLQTVSVEVDKDTYEVGQLLAGLIQDLKAKKSLAEIGSTRLPALMTAIDGIQNVPKAFGDDLGSALKGALIPISDALEELFKQPAVPPTP